MSRKELEIHFKELLLNCLLNRITNFSGSSDIGELFNNYYKNEPKLLTRFKAYDYNVENLADDDYINNTHIIDKNTDSPKNYSGIIIAQTNKAYLLWDSGATSSLSPGKCCSHAIS